MLQSAFTATSENVFYVPIETRWQGRTSSANLEQVEEAINDNLVKNIHA